METSVTTTGVNDDVALTSALRLAPNPTAEGAALQIDVDRVTPLDVSIYDMTGRRMWQFTWADVLPGTHVVSWDGRAADGSAVADGRYLVRVSTTSGAATAMLTVVR